MNELYCRVSLSFNKTELLEGKALYLQAQHVNFSQEQVRLVDRCLDGNILHGSEKTQF